MNEKKVTLTIIYNGEEVIKTVPNNRNAHSIIAEVLNGSPDLNPNDFYLKTDSGTVFQAHDKLIDHNITGQAILFMNRNDGGGGNE
ncbi:DUF2604 domain-containing protein [Pseudoneobacillus rhizosphaerae]|jgi:hypothetical protein|uniref:Uncharacterized protein n=1 Tax=Pseudoneobacillus rhizosphaerae TaxID=2880968 RepID=A0A9C7LD53_9BACI|nr:DUF2604 domain-containing protein [Pseudoneobacillus rhizosphaerae]CAG9610695.1 hypothetical protein NEOCIP111885_04471 [Pseudoneobacillus rhizosphaerae]